MRWFGVLVHPSSFSPTVPMFGFPIPRPGPLGRRSPLSSVLWEAPTSCASSCRTSFPSFGNTNSTALYSLRQARAPTLGGLGVLPGFPRPDFIGWKTQDLSGSWRIHFVHMPSSIDPDGVYTPGDCSVSIWPSARGSASASVHSSFRGSVTAAYALSVYASPR